MSFNDSDPNINLIKVMFMFFPYPVAVLPLTPKVIFIPLVTNVIIKTVKTIIALFKKRKSF